MVPGSTFRYGSHFGRVTLRPRLSSKQPIEAAATPLPREETTPPVTKMYFGPVRKVSEIPPRGVRTTHYAWNPGFCQTRIPQPSADPKTNPRYDAPLQGQPCAMYRGAGILPAASAVALALEGLVIRPEASQFRAPRLPPRGTQRASARM